MLPEDGGAVGPSGTGVAMRYGASSYAVYRSREDRYRFQQFATFAEQWNGT